MHEKLQKMSDKNLLRVWEVLRTYEPGEMYDAERGITMDEWAEAVNGEIHRRGIEH